MGSRHRSQKKRKRRPSSSPFKTQIGRRLEKLRRRPRNLWADSDDENTSHKKPCIVLTDSSEERSSSLPIRTKSRKKTTRSHSEKSATCLICSILSQLSANNCCSEHLSVLNNHQQHTTDPQGLPEQVMIIPITDEFAQQYLHSKPIHHRKSRASTQLKTSDRKIATRKSLIKPTRSLHIPAVQQSSESSQTDLPPLASTIAFEPVRSRSALVPPDVTISTVPSTSGIVVSQKIDDHQEKTTSNKQPLDPWTAISDEIQAALEETLNQIDSSSDSPFEFTPSTVRRTETEIMAARLPKLSLKPGRFRLGKPITDRTNANVANEYRPQSASGTSAAVPSSIGTSTEEQPSAAACQTSPRTEDITDDHIDIASSSIFTQDASYHYPTTIVNEDGTMDTGTDRTSRTIRLTLSTDNNKRTPSRFSLKLNPDGTRVSLSRPALSTNSHSPLVNTLRRTSTDVTPIKQNTKHV